MAATEGHRVAIDPESGFCFGVVTAIRKAEEELAKGGTLYCLGDIVHNEQEVERLERLGLVTIGYEEFRKLRHAKVLLRAHGEPPETYRIAQANGIDIADASCPVVLNLQRKIRETYLRHAGDAQILIFGKRGHAEVIGLQGQTDDTALVIEGSKDLDKVDFGKDIYLFSQTTKSEEEFKELTEEIRKRIAEAGTAPRFEWHDTICGQVRNRGKHIREFAATHDKVVFVGGANSSNGKVLCEHCRAANPDTLFIARADELMAEYARSCKGKRVGICGATSTPLWLMEECRRRIEEQTD